MKEIECCAICAWRETCQKKFTISGRSLHCPEFVRDISIKLPEEKVEGSPKICKETMNKEEG